MRIGIIVATLPGEDSSNREILGAPAPYRSALDDYMAAAADPEVLAKYSALELWTRTGIAKKRKLRGPAGMAPAPEAPAPNPAAKKKTAKKRVARK